MRNRTMLAWISVCGLIPAAVWAIGTSHNTVSEPTVTRPAYLTAKDDGAFGDKVTRIGGEPGTQFTFTSRGGTGTWGRAKPHSWKDQPWNSDGSLVAFENSGGTPTFIFLDGATFEPKYDNCPNATPPYESGNDARWMTGQPNQRVIIRDNGDLQIYDIVNCSVVHTWPVSEFPFNPVDYGIGSYEGNLMGNYLALNNASKAFIIDLGSQQTHVYWPMVSPYYVDLSDCGLADCNLRTSSGWTTLVAGPDWDYFVVMYPNDPNGTCSSDGTGCPDNIRVYDFQDLTYAGVSGRSYGSSGNSCGGGALSKGFIPSVAHADLVGWNGDAYVVGQRRSQCTQSGEPENGLGHVVAIKLSDGSAVGLSDTNDGSAQHISARATESTGRVAVTYDDGTTGLYGREVVTWPMNGTKTPERWIHTHTDSTASTCASEASSARCQAQAVFRPDGEMAIFTSTWSRDCGGTCAFTDPNGRYWGLGYRVHVPAQQQDCTGCPAGCEEAPGCQ